MELRAQDASDPPHVFERPQTGEAAVLVYVHQPGQYETREAQELSQLAASAGAVKVGQLSASRRSPDARYHIGSGKLEELTELVGLRQAELVIFGCPLTPAQERNLERQLKCRVVDRIGLILDLFAQRAQTFEGKLQVELAQLRHLSTRLVRGWTHLERQKGGIGLRGPGETQLETDRRLVAGRIRRISSKLDGVSRRRELSRRARRRSEVPVVSLVGYTNAGKSTLFNALTGAGVLAEDRLFATLDPTLRRLETPAGKTFLLADTVGFVGNLPHELVAAFRSTLEETLNATLLLHVVDASDPEWETRQAQVREVLTEIGAADIPELVVYNKADAVETRTADWSVDPGPGAAGLANTRQIWVSALTGEGLESLGEALDAALGNDEISLLVRIPYRASRLRSLLFEHTRVLEETADQEEGWSLRVEGPVSAIEKLRRKHHLDRYVVDTQEAPVS